MKKNIRSRLEFFLAKVAGKDVDITKLTPPVASDTIEELLLEIAERLDAASADPAKATTTKYGTVKKAANVPYAAGEAPTAAEFKALVDALVNASIMAPPANG